MGNVINFTPGFVIDCTPLWIVLAQDNPKIADELMHQAEQAHFDARLMGYETEAVERFIESLRLIVDA